MAKRGRQSADISIGSGHHRLVPPLDLNPAEANLFRELVASCAPEHFVHSDMPLLVSFVQAPFYRGEPLQPSLRMSP
jgi:hypothetical protein